MLAALRHTAESARAADDDKTAMTAYTEVLDLALAQAQLAVSAVTIRSVMAISATFPRASEAGT